MTDSAPALHALEQFLPQPVAEALVAAGGRLEPVEAKATVLFCDIEGFTALTNSLGPRRVFEFLNAYFEVVAGLIERHGGVVTQFQGDAVLAVFNVPLADRDYAAKALCAALAILRATETQAFAGMHVRCRIGISTGRVIAGAVGSHGRLSYTAHGNPVNRAARLEKLNQDYGTRILLCGKTAERCCEFKLRKVADAAIRGYADLLPVYTPESSA
jgi:adenylate cyclase